MLLLSKPKENKPSVGSGFDDDEDAFDEHKKHKEPSRSHTMMKVVCGMIYLDQVKVLKRIKKRKRQEKTE